MSLDVDLLDTYKLKLLENDYIKFLKDKKLEIEMMYLHPNLGDD